MPAPSRWDLEILDLLPGALICVADDQRIVAWNQAAQRLYGYAREEVVGLRAPDVLETRFAAPLSEVLEICSRTGHWRGTVVNRASDGHAVTVETRWSVCRDETGECVAVVSLGRELPAAVEEQALLTHTPDDLPQLAGAVAHDLNNALAVVVNYAALIAGELEGIHEQTGEERWVAMGGDNGEIRPRDPRRAQRVTSRGAAVDRRRVARRGRSSPRGVLAPRAALSPPAPPRPR